MEKAGKGVRLTAELLDHDDREQGTAGAGDLVEDVNNGVHLTKLLNCE